MNVKHSLRVVQRSRTGSGLSSLLLAKLLLKLSKLVHRDLLFRIHHLFDTLDLFDLPSS